MSPGATVELDPLLEAAGWAVAFGVGVPIAFAVGVRAFVAVAESNRTGHRLAAAVSTLIGAACVLAAVAAVVFALLAVSDG